MIENEERKIKKVIILGSGESILNLTDEEIKHINSCEIVIAVNKFTAFYKKAKITPTHVFFHDLFGINILLYILKTLKKDKIEGITLYTNSFTKNILYFNKRELFLKFIKDFLLFRLKALIIIIIKFGMNTGIHRFKLFRKITYYRVPKSYEIHSLKLTNWNSEEESWANTIEGDIYHYRGSLTTVLNIVSIIAPKYEISLVGNDFNGDKYFYENELDSLGIPWRDFTYDKVKKEKIHFSYHKINGKTMNDKIPFILKMLKLTGNKLSSNNSKSLLVVKSGIMYKKLLSND
jgi:hypothetical protein